MPKNKYHTHECEVVGVQLDTIKTTGFRSRTAFDVQVFFAPLVEKGNKKNIPSVVSFIKCFDRKGDAKIYERKWSQRLGTKVMARWYARSRGPCTIVKSHDPLKIVKD